MGFEWYEILFGAVSIVGFIEWIKGFDKEKKFKKYYKFLPLILSAAPAVFFAHYTDNFVWSYILLQWMGIFSFSIIGYQNIIELIQKRTKL